VDEEEVQRRLFRIIVAQAIALVLVGLVVIVDVVR